MSAALWNEPEHGAIEDSGWVNEVVCGTSVGGNLLAPAVDIKVWPGARNLSLLFAMLDAAELASRKLAVLYCSGMAKTRDFVICVF
jgi:hypothetical protein